jgi:hypothetical protein
MPRDPTALVKEGVEAGPDPVSTYAKERALWMQAAARAAANEAPGLATLGLSMMGLGLVAGPALLSQSDKLPNAAADATSAGRELLSESKREQLEYNEEMLQLPRAQRLSKGATNVLKGVGAMAIGPLGIGPLGPVAKAEGAVQGITRGPIGYYSALLDPRTAVDTAAADPFALALEAAPLMGSAATMLRKQSAALAKVAETKVGKVGARAEKGARGLDVLAEILDPTPYHYDAAQPVETSATYSRGEAKAKADAQAAGVAPEVVDAAEAKVAVETPKRQGIKYETAKGAASTMGRMLRGAAWGAIVLEPATALTGVPLLGFTAGALAHPAAKAAFRAVAKRKGIKPSEAQAAFDQALNDPNATGNPDVSSAVEGLMDARKAAATAEVYARRIASAIEAGEGVVPVNEAAALAPEPSRLGQKFSLGVDGSLTYDPVGTSKWFEYAANASEARTRAAALKVYAIEAKKEQTAARYALKTPENVGKFKQAKRTREMLDAATAGNERLLKRRIAVEERLQTLVDTAGIERLEQGVSDFRDYKRAAMALEDQLGGVEGVRDSRKLASEFRKVRSDYERAVMFGTQSIEKASAWFGKIMEEVGPQMDQGAVDAVKSAAARMDELAANPIMNRWGSLLDAQAAVRDRLRAIDAETTPYEVSWQGVRGRSTVRYKAASTFVREFEKAHAAAKQAHIEVAAGEPMTKARESAINKAQAMRMVMDDAAIDYLSINRERTRLLAALDDVVEQFGDSPGATKAALAKELQTLRREHADALKAERRADKALQVVLDKSEVQAGKIFEARRKYDEAKAVLDAKTGGIETLTATIDAVNDLFKRQKVDAPTTPELQARAMAGKLEEYDRKLTLGEAIAVELEGELAALVDYNGEVKRAFDALVASEAVDKLAKDAAKEATSAFPAEEKRALVKSNAAELRNAGSPMSAVSLEWTDMAITEIVGQLVDLASEWAPFADPPDPMVVARLFSMAALDNGIVHIMNKRALGAIAEFMTGPETPSRSKAVIAAKEQLSATVADLVAKSIDSNEWHDPTFRFGDGHEASLSTLVTSWMSTLDVPTKRQFKADTAKAIGVHLARQIQSHHMQGTIAADLARQMIPGDINNTAAPFKSFADWAQGGAQAVVVPFDVAELRQQLLGGPLAVQAFIDQAVRMVDPESTISYEFSRRMSPDGVLSWLDSMNNYVEVIGDTVKAREQKSGSLAAFGGAAAGAIAGGLAAGPVGAAGLAVAGGIMAPQFLAAASEQFHNLRVFLEQTAGGMRKMGYAPVDKAWVHRGAATAMDAQVAYIKNVSKTETLMKVMLTAFSVPTWTGNLLSNAFLAFLTEGYWNPFQLLTTDMPKAARDLARWREGLANDYEAGKWLAFSKSGLMESSVVADVLRDWGTSNAGGKVRSAFEDTMKVATTFYAAQDGLAKAAAFSKQYDALNVAINGLGEGEYLKTFVGPDRTKTIMVDKGDFVLLEGDKRVVTSPSEPEFQGFVGEAARLSAAARYFDFSQLPGVLRRRDTMISAFAAPLFGWAFKALDAPGKSGMMSAVLGYAPSTSYSTNSPALLNAKAQELAGLAVKRSAIMAVTRAEAEAAEVNPRLADALSYGIPGLSWIGMGEPKDGVLNYGEQNNINPFLPTLTLMRLGVQGVTGVMDLVGFGPETKTELANARRARMSLTEQQREQAKWDRFWYDFYSGKGGTMQDFLRVAGLSGNFLASAMQVANDPSASDTQMRALARNSLRMVFPKTPVDIVDVLIGTMFPESALTSRKEVRDTALGAMRPENAWLMATKMLAGIGVRELDAEGAAKRLAALRQKIDRSMKRNIVGEIKDIRSKLRRDDLTPDARATLEADLERLQEQLRQRGEWRYRDRNKVPSPKEGWLEPEEDDDEEGDQ